MDDLNFPKIKNISPKLLADDIKGYNPSDPKDVTEWRKIVEDLYKNLKGDFDKAGKKLPEIHIIQATPDYSDLELKPVKPMKLK